MRRYRDGQIGGLGGLEQAANIGHCVVLLDALADDTPGDAFGAQKIDLGIGDD